MANDQAPALYVRSLRVPPQLPQRAANARTPHSVATDIEVQQSWHPLIRLSTTIDVRRKRFGASLSHRRKLNRISPRIARPVPTTALTTLLVSPGPNILHRWI